MSIYYENGCFSLWNADSLDFLPKMKVKKIAKILGKNQHRDENEESLSAFCEWLCAKIEFFNQKLIADRLDKDAAKQLKYYISLAEVL